jgi:hypothetical protein
MHKRFDTGKQPYDAAKDTQATVPSHKPCDFIRLSSESTRENPRLLGGTKDDGRKYLDDLDPQQKDEYRKFINTREKSNTEIASRMHPAGHAIHLEYRKQRSKPPEGAIVQKTIGELNNAIISQFPDGNYAQKIKKQAEDLYGPKIETSKGETSKKE